MGSIYQRAFLHARFHLQVSLRSFGKMMGVDNAFLSRIEQGKQQPSLNLIKQLERVTGFSFWALVAKDLKPENQAQYFFISHLNFENMTIDFSELNPEDRSFLRSKFDVELQELSEELKTTKAKFSARLEKSNLKEGELDALEETLQKAQVNLDFLSSSNAPAELIADQQAKVDDAQTTLTEKRRKSGIISDRAAVLEQVDIEEIELKIKLRQDKIAEIDALG